MEQLGKLDKPTSRDQRYRITDLGLVAPTEQEDAE